MATTETQPKLSAEQVKNARTVIGVGKHYNFPARRPGRTTLVNGVGIRISHLKRLAFLILPAVLVLSVPTVASANYIANVSDGIGLGVIRAHDGSYTYGNYDAVLPADGISTITHFGWPITAGWYTGPGYCTAQWRSDTGWGRQVPDLGPGQHFIGASTNYEVFAYKHAAPCPYELDGG